MLETLLAIEILCSSTLCTYDAGGMIPSIVMLDCSMRMGDVKQGQIRDPGGSVVLVIKSLPCRSL